MTKIRNTSVFEIQKHYDKGLSYSECSAIFGISTMSWARRNGLNLRSSKIGIQTYFQQHPSKIRTENRLCVYCKTAFVAVFPYPKLCCSIKCARKVGGDSTKNNLESRKKISAALTGRGKIFIWKTCPICAQPFKSNKKTCSRSCGTTLAMRNPAARLNLSIKNAENACKRGKFTRSIRCTFIFNNQQIRCDSLLEYACLEWIARIKDPLLIQRATVRIPFDYNGKTLNFIPDFLVKTSKSTFIVECKSYTVTGTLNNKWRKYREKSPLKKQALEKYCLENGFECIWYTPSTDPKHYKFRCSNKPFSSDA